MSAPSAIVVTAITPVFDGASFLADAAATLASQDLPSFIELEWVIVDDGSTDQSASIALGLAATMPFDCRLLRLDANASPAAARNAALLVASGDLVTFLDVDDLWPPDRLQLLARRLLDDDTIGFVHGTMRPSIAAASAAFWKGLGFGPSVAAPSLLATGLYRRELFDRIGHFDEQLRFGEDMDWYLRAVEAGIDFAILDRVVLDYRMHDRNTTIDRAAVDRSVAQVMARSVIRRRRLGITAPLPVPSDHLEPVIEPVVEPVVEPVYSVVIPVRNGAAFLRRAVESVLCEGRPGIEIVIVDDGSTDSTPAVINELRASIEAGRLGDGTTTIVTERVEMAMPSATRNVGLAMSSGRFVAFVDADDEWLPAHWSVLATCLDERDDIEVVWGLIAPVFDEDADPMLRLLYGDGSPLPVPVVGAALFRRSAFARIGNYDEQLRFGEDIDWYLRANEARIGILLLDVPVIRYHVHATNMTTDFVSTKRAQAIVMARSLRRRRLAGDIEPLRQLSEHRQRVIER